jgi:hypothetical protein
MEHDWEFANDKKFLIMDGKYLFDLTDIDSSFFKRIKSFSVVMNETKTLIKLGIFSKMKIISKLQDNLYLIRIKINRDILNKLSNELNTQRDRLHTLDTVISGTTLPIDGLGLSAGTRYDEYMTGSTSTFAVNSHAEGFNTTAYGVAHSDFFMGLGNIELSQTDENDKIKKKAKEVLDNSITKEEILTRKNKEEEFRRKMEKEKERIKEIIKRSRRKAYE